MADIVGHADAPIGAQAGSGSTNAKTKQNGTVASWSQSRVHLYQSAVERLSILGLSLYSLFPRKVEIAMPAHKP